PDGLDVITHENLRDIYSNVQLIDLCGINTRFQARLNANGIFTPIQFLDASLQLLKKNVFQSINGYYWYLRLRGWEIDSVEFARKSYGQSYALGKKSADPKELAPLLMKLTEKMARRLRASNSTAKGIHVACVYTDYTFWHKGRMFETEMYTTSDLFKKVMLIFNQQPQRKIVGKLAVSCYELSSSNSSQLDLFDNDSVKKRKVSDACDAMNDRYGEYVITPALMMGLQDQVIDRIAFGGVKDLEEIYAGL
ncbi:MAG: hypothetical protein ACRDFB_03200, partial [Rhabdochlamydiaceae bacterium]